MRLIPDKKLLLKLDYKIDTEMRKLVYWLICNVHPGISMTQFIEEAITKYMNEVKQKYNVPPLDDVEIYHFNMKRPKSILPKTVDSQGIQR
jgi:hypothetical protein